MRPPSGDCDLRLLGPGDARLFDRVAPGVFDNPVDPRLAAEFLGRSLLQRLFERGRELGCTEAWCGTEHGNLAARRMYAAVGGVEQAMVYVAFALEPSPAAAV